MKPLSLETLGASTRIEIGAVNFVPVEGGKGRRLFEVQCDIKEVPVGPVGLPPRKPRTIKTDEFGHLGTEHQLWAQQRRGGPRK